MFFFFFFFFFLGVGSSLIIHTSNDSLSCLNTRSVHCASLAIVIIADNWSKFSIKLDWERHEGFEQNTSLSVKWLYFESIVSSSQFVGRSRNKKNEKTQKESKRKNREGRVCMGSGGGPNSNKCEKAVIIFVCLVSFLTSSSATRLYRGKSQDWRLTILCAATHGTERGDHDFCLRRSHHTYTDPTSRERAATAEIEPRTSSPGVARSTDWATAPPEKTVMAWNCLMINNTFAACI